MDVLAGRKTGGIVEGDIRVNGHPQSSATFARLNGYCEQQDVHLGTETVRNAIEFSAALRLPASVTSAERAAFVEQILVDLELVDLQHRLIGDENIVGLSPGELKRVTIAVELAANPSILFLDEPTSSLDSRAALVVVRVIRKIAARGRAVICTIHQPSAQLLTMFDRLLLLQTGGRTAFFGDIGDEANDLVEYFVQAELPEGSFRPKLGVSQNPASWMLDVIGAGTSHKNRSIPNYADIFSRSELNKLNAAQLDFLNQRKGAVPSFDTLYARSMWTQFSEVLKRMSRVYFRDIQNHKVRTVAFSFLLVVMGLLYRDINDTDEFGVISKMSSVFVTAGFMGFTVG
jgi:ABC-type multidrug transport system ATPase subunit